MLAPPTRLRRVPAQPAARPILVALFGGSLAWTLHLLASYLVVALWCASGWRGLSVMVAVLTVLCAAAALASAVLAYRLWRRAQAALLSGAEPGVAETWDARMGERGARMAFLAILALFLDAMFVYLILLEGLPAAFAPSCPVWTVP